MVPCALIISSDSFYWLNCLTHQNLMADSFMIQMMSCMGGMRISTPHHYTSDLALVSSINRPKRGKGNHFFLPHYHDLTSTLLLRYYVERRSYCFQNSKNFGHYTQKYKRMCCNRSSSYTTKWL